MMKTVLGLAVLVTLSMVGRAADHPNVVFILADDLGYGDLSILGQKKLETPNIDRLGREGIIFTEHYSGNTVCSPSRANLMTGQHPGHVHCRANGNEPTLALDPAMTTLPRLFKNAGYATGAFGKWGLGHTNAEGAQNPLTHGFDAFSGWKSQMIAHTYYPTSIVRNGKEELLEPGTYVHDLIMVDAFNFIRQSAEKGQPFFCYIPTAIPHAAMHAPAELHEKWRKVFSQFDRKIGKYGAGKGESCPPVTNPIAGFAGMIEHLDNQVGELLRVLKELGVDRNTLVIFTSDNGAHREGGHDPTFWDSNGPFRGIKRDFYEGGIHAPFLARWPEAVAAGRESDHISAFWDILPTMAELTGQPVPTQTDGISILPTLRGEEVDQKKHPYLYWESSRRALGMQAVRMEQWKAVRLRSRKGKIAKLELYNLKTDIGEDNDVAGEHPEIVQRMEQIMGEAHTPLPRWEDAKKAEGASKTPIPPDWTWISRDATVTHSSLSTRFGTPHNHTLLTTMEGKQSFHTDKEERPWIVIDLKRERPVVGLEILNRPDLIGRAQNLRVWASGDNEHWNEVFRATAALPRWLVKIDQPHAVRYIKIGLIDTAPQYFHLKGVKVFAK
ncbi:MAG: sulfatase-like hydrolase/transferase [Lentisphaerae bacterium]|jgi:arylsulfatase A-like enzyme|nr:sulfatase-like hydrolase/transferase [Lentisphaerota bacterium]MBT4821934.1 sulfatase-like hydrolase/transferase [Lentisphaerota bacterium]MBT5612652.1 sulfatase-like hydrolase/transferase [Lentisphaerota bacterium]MBT7053676.1 sulfatase-like hydrolase/transferase [Lentisphaerota bacterium]MBT7841137.1 sulfatase-like hydrolase/transferase [Lentisphaerota bacterium]